MNAASTPLPPYLLPSASSLEERRPSPPLFPGSCWRKGNPVEWEEVGGRTKCCKMTWAILTMNFMSPSHRAWDAWLGWLVQLNCYRYGARDYYPTCACQFLPQHKETHTPYMRTRKNPSRENYKIVLPPHWNFFFLPNLRPVPPFLLMPFFSPCPLFHYHYFPQRLRRPSSHRQEDVYTWKLSDRDGLKKSRGDEPEQSKPDPQ